MLNSGLNFKFIYKELFMKKALTIALLVVVSISLTGCLKKDTSGGSAADNDKEEILNGSLADIMTMGKNVKCTYSAEDEDGKSEGTIYVSGNKSRNDIYVESPEGLKEEVHMIVNKEYMYSWSSAQEQGSKMKLDSFDVEDGDYDKASLKDNLEAYRQYQGEEGAVDFKCSPWIPNGSVFDPPSDIEFVDMSAMMETFQQDMEDFQEDAKSMCSMCDMMSTEEEKAECLKNLGCE
jgi:hypothetical protein